MSGYAGIALRLFTLFVWTIAVAGCSSSKPKPADFHIHSAADSRLNPDFNDQPLSVVLNVYQLRDRQTFARLTFEDFVSGKSDESLLREDIVSRTELVVLPGNKQTIDARLEPDAQYLGVVAIYRMPADQQWRYLIPAEQIRKKGLWEFGEEKTVSIRLHGCYIAVEGVDIDIIPGQKAVTPPSCPAIAANSSPASGSETSPQANDLSAASTLDRVRAASETANNVSGAASSASDTTKTLKSLMSPR